MAAPPDPVFVLRAHEADVTAVVFIRNNTILASGDQEGHIILWSVLTRRPIRRWRAHTSGILAIHSVAGDNLLSHGRDDQLHIWSLCDPSDKASSSPQKPEFTLLVNSLNFCGVSLWKQPADREGGAEQTLLALPGLGENAEIDIYNLSTKTYTLQGLSVPNASKDTGLCMCLKFFEGPTGLCLAAGYESGTIIIWDIESKGLVWRHKVHEEPVLSLDVLPDGSIGFSGGAETKISQFFPISDPEQTTRHLTVPTRGIAVVRIRPDGKIVATGGWDSKIRIYNAKKFKPLAILRGHRQGVSCLAFSEAGSSHVGSETNSEEVAPPNMFAAGSKDGNVTLWQIY
ncbi:uncharacterized protein SPPG_00502 [Spizellomyces punctatus DAOM BR117]|uniref:ASTRA-associated protein 1 n=1 Tax=Spizellomyces punctatus (strain DAOM BR117) TaxID=645134 RepID=A0A0L0HV75_SPIPD|nr:uncharacterized protein SPPG_00502 [Spizellomyces punctatus DAOM BR117]KND04800.1 hypothetical protein SPPG_00502 [Spizellomyces punctatus DAOM BR117]|eukprot:XP_016612839.1 hypothetical protein SPPG_00502 [Spizellomyces punctatus DAOM BR117]